MKSQKSNITLKVYLSVLLIKELSFNSKLKEFKNKLKEKFNKDYSLKQIEEELIAMKLENEFYGSIKELPDDYEMYNI